MPMPIQSVEEYDKVINVSWYSPDSPREEQVYVPCMLHPHDNLPTISVDCDSGFPASYLSPKCIHFVASTFEIF